MVVSTGVNASVSRTGWVAHGWRLALSIVSFSALAKSIMSQNNQITEVPSRSGDLFHLVSRKEQNLVRGSLL